MNLRKFRDAGDGAGGTDPGSAGGASDPNAANAGDNKPEGSGTQNLPEDFDYKAEYEKMKPLHDELTTNHETLKTTVGKQGNQLTALKDIQKAMKDDPRGLIKRIAEDGNLNKLLSFSDETPKEFNVNELFDGDKSPEEKTALFNEYLTNRDKTTLESAMDKLQPEFTKIHEDRMRIKFPDYDDLLDDRMELLTNLKSKSITMDEVLHFASKAQHLDKVIAESEKNGYDKAIKEISQKMQDGVTIPANFLEDKKGKPDAKEYLDNVINKMTLG